jgi:hypothetical protein
MRISGGIRMSAGSSAMMIGIADNIRDQSETIEDTQRPKKEISA